MAAESDTSGARRRGRRARRARLALGAVAVIGISVLLAISLAAVAVSWASAPGLLAAASRLGASASPGAQTRIIDRITVHHTASPAVVGAGSVDVTLVASWHREKGLGAGAGDRRDCAYHFLILPDGAVQEGRPIDWAGSGTRDLEDNRRSVAIALVGDFEPAHNGGETFPSTPTGEQMEALAGLASELMSAYGIGPEAVHGHGEVSSSACPGSALDMEAVRNRLREGGS